MPVLSSPGYFNPEDQEQLDAIQRKQAYARALMGADMPQGQYGGLASAGKQLAGALIARKADKDERDLTTGASQRYTKALADFLGGAGGSPGLAPPQQPPLAADDPSTGGLSGNLNVGGVSPQISNTPGSGPQMPQPGQGPSPDSQRLAQQLSGGSPPPAPAPSAPSPSPPQTDLQRLAATGNPMLMQQFGPTLYQHQMGRQDSNQDYQRNRTDLLHDRKVTDLDPNDPRVQGLRGRWQVDANGGLHQIEKPDTLTQEAERQKIRIAEAGRSNMGGYGPNAVFSTIDTGNGMYALDRTGHVKPLAGTDGKPLVSYHSDVPLRYDMGAASAGGKAAGATAEALPTTEAMFGEMQKSIAALKTPEMRKQAGWNTGLTGMTGIGRLPGVGSEFANTRDQLTSQTFLQGFNALRGAGAITEKEGEAATNAFTRLKKAQTNGEFYRALDDADATLSKINDAIKQRAGRGAVVPRLGGGPDQAAPQQQQPHYRRYNPATGQIE